MNRIALVLGWLALAGGLFWLFPLFHIVRLDELQAVQQETLFDATHFAERFWSERMLPALSQAADAGAVLAALRQDAGAREKYGRKVGVSRARLFLLRGSGTVVSAGKQGVGLSLDPERSEPDIVLHTGLLFGNAARDATGLLDAGDFAHSQHFNDISTELNRIIEERVIPALREESQLGRRIQFVGCAEVPDYAGEPRPLVVIPLQAGAP